MTRLDWNSAGKRIFEAGLDRGVLYVGTNAGVSWPGLVSISRSPSGGAVTSYYTEGVKYLQTSESTEWEGTLEAYASPVEFDVCDGASYTSKGLGFMDQPRKEFGLSYRTLVGNDLTSTSYGYQIHILYNVLSEPTEKPYSSISDKTEALSLSWALKARPEAVTGRKPSAHLIVDSRRILSADLLTLENMLYGSAGTAPRLPLPTELLTFLT